MAIVRRNDPAWGQTKKKAAETLSDQELQKIVEERKRQEEARQRDTELTKQAHEQRDKMFWEQIRQSCTTGTQDERLAKCLVRASNHGYLKYTPLLNTQERVQGIATLLRLHNIQDSKSLPTIQEYEREVRLFDADPLVHRADVSLIRKTLETEKNG
jgi:hypothetical protein